MTEERDDTYFPPSFGEALEDNYLGRPEVIRGLVAHACSQLEHLLTLASAQEIPQEEFTRRVKKGAEAFSDILSGRNPEYKPIAGWNSFTLPIRVRTELSTFWTSQSEAYDNDPLQVLFAYLLWAIHDAKKRSGDADDSLVSVFMIPRIDSIINLLLGTGRK